jgi:hypothetical protein
MDGVGASLSGGGDDAVDAEIAVARCTRSDGVRFVGESDVQRSAIAFGVHGDRRHPHFTARANHADRYLSSICDKNFAQQLV